MVLIPKTGAPGPIYNDVAAQGAGSASNTTFLLAANNLSDVVSRTLARINLGLGTAALSQTTDFDASGAAATALAQAEAYARSLLSGTGTVTFFSSGNLSPLFTTSVATATSTPALSFTLSNAPASSVFGNSSTSPAPPSFQNFIDLVQTTVGSTNLLLLQNKDTGVTSTAVFGIANSTSNILSVITSTGFSGALITGGSTGTSGNVYTNGNIPLNLGANSKAAITLGVSQTLTLPGYTTAGIITNNGTGLLASLSNASSPSSVLLGLMGAGAPSSSNFLRGDGTWATPSSATIPNSKELLSNVSGTIIGAANVFNVQAYGAVGDGATNDGTAIAAAITALVANTSLAVKGVLYFPAGTYLVTSAIAISIANPFTFTVRGDGMLSSVIYQTTSATDGMTITLAKAGGGQAFSTVEVCDLGFTTNTTAACALRVTYGTATVSTEYGCGLNIRNINIVNNGSAPGPNLSNTYGWNNGIYLNSPWKVMLHNINGAGGWTAGTKPVTAGYTTATTVGPTTGGSVPGGGALITIYGGINVALNQIYGCYFSCGIFFGNMNQGASTVAGVQNPQLSNINLVAVNVGIFQAPGLATTAMQVSNLGIDFGSADSTVANVGLFINGDPVNLRGENSFTNCTFTPTGGTAGDVMIQFNNVLVSSVTGATMFPNIPAGSFAVKLLGSCDRNVFNGCGFGSGALSVGASCTNNLANNTQGSTTAAWTGVATNLIKTALF